MMIAIVIGASLGVTLVALRVGYVIGVRAGAHAGFKMGRTARLRKLARRK